MDQIRKILGLGYSQDQQRQIEEQAEIANAAADRALRRLDELATSPNPLAKFAHSARNASFRSRIRRGETN